MNGEEAREVCQDRSSWKTKSAYPSGKQTSLFEKNVSTMLRQSESPVCPLCLSTERTVHNVSRVMWAYRVVVDLQPPELLSSDQTVTPICWECRAILTRLQNFRTQVQRAQHVLLSGARLETLSRLRVCHGTHLFVGGDLNEPLDLTDKECKDDIDLNIECEVTPHDIWVNSVPFYDLHEDDIKTELVHEDTNSHANNDLGASIKHELTTRKELKEKKKLKKEMKLFKKRLKPEVRGKCCRKKFMDNKCEICNKTFKTSEKCFRHHFEMHKKAASTRESDEKRFKKQRKSRQADQTIPVPERNRETGTLDCDRCDAKLKSAEYYRVHYRAHVSEQQYECAICNRTYNTRRMIILHLKKHRPMKYLCDICGIPNRTQHTLKIHMYSHATFDERRYKCDLCPRKFSMADKLRIHQLRHTGVKSFKCHLCDYSFFVKFELTKHLQTHHGIETQGRKRSQTQRTRSAVTNKPFTSVAEPNVRKVGRFKKERDPNANKSFLPSGTTCEFCGKTFANKVALKSHKVVHTGDRPYRCGTCGKTFKFHSNVLTHNLSVHAADKAHECAACGARFKLKGNLTVHMKTHTGEKPYTCDICNQKFIRRRNLNNHYKVHMK